MCMCEFLTTSDTIWSRSQGYDAPGVQIYANLLQGSGGSSDPPTTTIREHLKKVYHLLLSQ